MAIRRSFGTGMLAGILATLLLLAALGLIVVYAGAYNVAATDGHAPLARWALDTTMQNSVRSRAEGLTAPEFTPADLRAGAQEFAEYCVHCHGAPGAEPHEWASGMLPNPPRLSHAAETWSVEEIFWIAKHGIKMSGMPPFAGEGDRALWNIAAFVDRLPAMTAAEYRALTGGGGGEGGGEPGGGHGHDHTH